MTAATLIPAAFAQEWRGATTTEKALAQEHLLDFDRILLCLFGTLAGRPRRLAAPDPDVA